MQELFDEKREEFNKFIEYLDSPLDYNNDDVEDLLQNLIDVDIKAFFRLSKKKELSSQDYKGIKAISSNRPGYMEKLLFGKIKRHVFQHPLLSDYVEMFLYPFTPECFRKIVSSGLTYAFGTIKSMWQPLFKDFMYYNVKTTAENDDVDFARELKQFDNDFNFFKDSLLQFIILSDNNLSNEFANEISEILTKSSNGEDKHSLYKFLYDTERITPEYIRGNQYIQYECLAGLLSLKMFREYSMCIYALGIVPYDFPQLEDKEEYKKRIYKFDNSNLTVLKKLGYDVRKYVSRIAIETSEFSSKYTLSGEYVYFLTKNIVVVIVNENKNKITSFPIDDTLENNIMTLFICEIHEKLKLGTKDGLMEFYKSVLLNIGKYLIINKLKIDTADVFKDISLKDGGYTPFIDSDKHKYLLLKSFNCSIEVVNSRALSGAEDAVLLSVHNKTKSAYFNPKGLKTKLLFHGAPLDRWYNIINDGMMMAKEENDKYYGNGLYFADHLEASLVYCNNKFFDNEPVSENIFAMGVFEVVAEQNYLKVGAIYKDVTYQDGKAPYALDDYDIEKYDKDLDSVHEYVYGELLKNQPETFRSGVVLRYIILIRHTPENQLKEKIASNIYFHKHINNKQWFENKLVDSDELDKDLREDLEKRRRRKKPGVKRKNSNTPDIQESKYLRTSSKVSTKIDSFKKSIEKELSRLNIT